MMTAEAEELQMAEGEGALDGIRVVDLGTYVFGPAAATVMADFGADVVKIEHPAGDPYRMLFKIPPMPVSERDYCWGHDSRNKRSLALDLTRDGGRDVLLRLVKSADVLVTNFHPSILKRFQLEYEDLAPLNDRLIYAHATGYGEEGDEIEKPGFDMTAWWARSGLMNSVHDGGTPALSVAGMGDHPSAMSLFGAVMLAMYKREQTGKGTKVSTSLMANGAWANSCLLAGALIGAAPYSPTPRLEARNVLINHYATADGRRFILAGIRPDDWDALCAAIERPDLKDDPKYATREARGERAQELIGILDEAFAKRTLAEWHERFEKEGLTSGRVLTNDDVAKDEQMAANGVFLEVDDPEHGPTRVINSPIAVRGYEKRKPDPAPGIGQHTEEILREVGYSEAEIATLLEKKVAGAGGG